MNTNASPTGYVIGALLLAGLAGVATAQGPRGGIDALDANDDGVISRQEAMDAQVASFRRMDTDGDGTITREELEPAQAAIEGDTSSPAVRRAREAARERWIDNLDRDDSGGISLEEYQAAMTPYFDQLDADDNGEIDPEELRQGYGLEEQGGG